MGLSWPGNAVYYCTWMVAGGCERKGDVEGNGTEAFVLNFCIIIVKNMLLAMLCYGLWAMNGMGWIGGVLFVRVEIDFYFFEAALCLFALAD